MHAVAKLTSKFQATIPAPVREVLEIKQGDPLAFEIRDGVVTLRRATRTDIAFAKAVEGTLREWHFEADERAYGDL